MDKIMDKTNKTKDKTTTATRRPRATSAKKAAQPEPRTEIRAEATVAVTANLKNERKPQTSAPEPGVNCVFNLEDAIRHRAYQLYLERGSRPGFAHEDWVRAEREVRSRSQSTSRAAAASA